MLARSIKQNKYSIDTVGTTYKSIFQRSLASAAGSNCTSDRPYLAQNLEDDLRREGARRGVPISRSVATFSGLMSAFMSSLFMMKG